MNINRSVPVKVAENLESVRKRIQLACRRAGRPPEAVTLVVVSKTRPPETIRTAVEAGARIFGESRVQEAAGKIEQCPSGLFWHFMGHLQSNKVRPAVAMFDMIHSVDSAKLLEALEDAAAEQGRCLDICLQVNVSEEASKHGIRPSDVPGLAVAAAACRRLRLRGLMTIPPLTRDPGGARPFFQRLREVRQSCYDCAGVEDLGLSMGMSRDFEVAIEEGADWIRVGSAIFGRRSG